jgi:hypothetical protein
LPAQEVEGRGTAYRGCRGGAAPLNGKRNTANTDFHFTVAGSPDESVHYVYLLHQWILPESAVAGFAYVVFEPLADLSSIRVVRSGCFNRPRWCLAEL